MIIHDITRLIVLLAAYMPEQPGFTGGSGILKFSSEGLKQGKNGTVSNTLATKIKLQQEAKAFFRICLKYI